MLALVKPSVPLFYPINTATGYYLQSIYRQNRMLYAYQDPSHNKQQLFCRDQHDYFPLNLVCLNPQCATKPLICSKCVLREHFDHKNQIQSLDYFKSETLKTLSINANSPNLDFCQSLKETKKRLLQKIAGIEKSMSQIIYKLKLALNNEFQIVIQSFNPSTYQRELQLLEESLDQKKISTVYYKIKVILENKFGRSSKNVANTEKCYNEVLEFTDAKLIEVIGKIQTLKEVKDMIPAQSLKSKMIQQGKSQKISNFSAIKQKIKVQGNKKNKNKGKNSLEIETQEPEVIQIDSSVSADKSSSSKERSRQKYSQVLKRVKQDKPNIKNIKSTCKSRRPGDERKKITEPPFVLQRVAYTRKEQGGKIVEQRKKEPSQKSNKQQSIKSSNGATSEKRQKQTVLMVKKTPPINTNPTSNVIPKDKPEQKKQAANPKPYLNHKMPERRPQDMKTAEIKQWFEKTHTPEEMPYSRILSHRIKDNTKYYLLFFGNIYKWYSYEDLVKNLDEKPAIEEYQELIKRYN